MRGVGRIHVPGASPAATRSFTPAVTQSGAPTYTSRSGYFTRIPGTRWVQGAFVIVIAGTGGAVANNPVAITEPVNHAAWYVGGIGGSFVIGTGTIYDASSGLIYPAHLVTGAAGAMYLLPSHNTTGVLMGYTASSSFAAALTTSDAITGTFMYEAAT
jgi:hypothetical protein